MKFLVLLLLAAAGFAEEDRFGLVGMWYAESSIGEKIYCFDSTGFGFYGILSGDNRGLMISNVVKIAWTKVEDTLVIRESSEVPLEQWKIIESSDVKLIIEDKGSHYKITLSKCTSVK